MEHVDQQFIEQKINPVLESLVTSVLQERPGDPALHMLKSLMKQRGQDMPVSEKEELRQLRRQMAALKAEHKEEHVSQSESDEEDEDLVELPTSIPMKSMPRVSVSAEAFGSWNKKENFTPPVYPKAEEQMNRIKDKLSKAFMFQILNSKETRIVIDAMQEKHVQCGEVVIEQGQNGDDMYVVDSGTLTCSKLFPNESSARALKEYVAGEAFGELALLYNAPRAASITASSDCVLWVLDRPTFNNIVKDAAMKKREMYESFMTTVPLFQSIDNYEKSQIAEAFQSVEVQQGEYVVQEGDWGDVFYVIEEGEAIATKALEPGKPAQKVKEYRPGDYFGELSLLRGEPRAANIISTTYMRCATLDRRAFKRMLGPLEEILKRNAEVYNQFLQQSNN